MSGGWLDIEGGTGGTAVGLEALDAASGQLLRLAREVGVAAGLVAATGADPELALSIPLSPLTAARAEAGLARLAGPLGLAGEAGALTRLALTTRAATRAYREVDEQVARSVAATQDAIMGVAGLGAPHVVVGLLVLDAVGVDLPGALDTAAFDHPAIADLAGGVDGLVVGLAVNPLTAPLVRPGPSTGRGEGARGGPEAHALRVLADSAAVWGLLSDEGRAKVTAEPSARSGAAAPGDLAGLVRDQANLGDGTGYPGHVRVIEVPDGTGSAWVVEVSGTQTWAPHAGGNPFDVTTDVRALGQESTVLAQGVQEALEQAQGDRAGAGEPVMLVGHSLGGIIATGLACDPAFRARHRVTHVVTIGSPVSRMPVPADVAVLSLEHHQDAVPRLDGVANPDRANWVTATRTLPERGDHAGTASGAHSTREYEQTAALVDTSPDPSVQDWRESSRAFFARHGDARAPTITDYRVERVPDP